MRRLAALLIAALAITTTAAQSPNWSAVDVEALETLQASNRINASVSPGDVTETIGPAIRIIYDAFVERARRR